MGDFLNALKDETNYTLTENGATTHKTTRSDLYDMFSLGGAMRSRPDEDVILMFRKAFAENPTYALKCLFYLRDARGGQGERRFFKVCIKDLANTNPDVMKRNLEYVPEFGRWDDLYAFFGTKLEKDAFDVIRNQLALDLDSKTPSLLAKWLKSENASSREAKYLGNKTRLYLNMTHRQYRKTLSILRERINIVERLMSENRWDEIEFDKIPSKAGLIYKNAFARRDIIKKKYEAFAKDETTTVNAKALYPYEVVHQACNLMEEGWHYRSRNVALDDTNRLIINKYWDNLADYINGAIFNGMAVVDTSGSMTCSSGSVTPLDVAISLGMYCAEKANGPFKNHYISFSSKPQLIAVEGVDFCDKVDRIYRTNLCENTDIEATFDLVLDTAIKNHMAQEDLPQNLIVISDMEFDQARGHFRYTWNRQDDTDQETLIEGIEKKWNAAGYKMPNLVFWNVDARQDNIPMTDKNGITFCSGFSPVLFEQIMSGKTGQDLMFDKLNSERYACIN